MWFATFAGVAVGAVAFGLYSRVAWPWMVLGFVGFVPWLAALDRAPSLRHALLSGICMSVAFVGAVFWWFITGIGEYTGDGVIVAGVAVALLAPLFQPQFPVVALVHRLTRDVPAFWLRATAIALTYTAAEWVVPKLFGDTIGHGLYASRRLRQAADVAGAPGLTFVLVLVNVCVLEGWRRWREGGLRQTAVPLMLAGAAIAVLSGYGVFRLRQLEAAPARARITAGIVQANLGRYGRLASEMGTYEATRLILETHFRLSAEALEHGGVDLLVWPETVYPTTFGAPKSEAGAELDREIVAFAAAAGVPLIFGTYDRDGDAEYNAAMFLRAAEDRTSTEVYRKGSLFPLTERAPWPLDTETARRWWPWLGTWQAGDRPRSIGLALPEAGTVQIAPLICYDAVDPRRALTAVDNGAEIIVTLSNDSWFSAGGGPWLHLVVSAFRSLETRRAQIRATNTGISAFITETGDIIAGAGVGEQAAVVATVPLVGDAGGLMTTWGDWFGPASAVGAMVLLGLARRRRPSAA